MDHLPTTPGEYEDQVFEDLTLRGEVVSRAEFYDCVFVRCSFPETTFRDCRFRDCAFKSCDLSLVHVPNCSFSAVRFEDSKLVGINWTEASWAKEGFLNSVDFFNCVISYSVFFGLNLRRINLTGCVAKDVNFTEADLTEANCTATDFSESRFFHTDLTQADFSGAVNYSINASVNTLSKTKFSLPEAMSLLHSLDIVLVE